MQDLYHPTCCGTWRHIVQYAIWPNVPFLALTMAHNGIIVYVGMISWFIAKRLIAFVLAHHDTDLLCRFTGKECPNFPSILSEYSDILLYLRTIKNWPVFSKNQGKNSSVILEESGLKKFLFNLHIAKQLLT